MGAGADQEVGNAAMGDGVVGGAGALGGSGLGRGQEREDGQGVHRRFELLLLREVLSQVARRRE